MQIFQGNQYDWWAISKSRYEAKMKPIEDARKAVISQYAEINKKIKEGKL